MSRRSNRSDPDFGSDSFLDIIANIVGILIILIVVAGVKVSRQPVERSDVESSNVAESVQMAAIPAHVSTDTAKLHESMTLPESTPVDPAGDDEPWDANFGAWIEVDEQSDTKPEQPQHPAPVVSIVASPELLRRRDELSSSVSKVKLRIADVRRKQLNLADQVKSHREQVEAAVTESIRTAEELERTERLAGQSRRSLQELRLQLATLKKELKTAQQPNIKLQTIRHRLNPVSREVSDKEVHFRLSKGRLSLVPIAELLDETMRQIRRRSDSLMRFNRHTGRVGPVGGYAMNYVVERQALTVLEKLREGGGYVRIEVTESTIEPTDSLREMTVDEALRPGSEFSSKLHQVGVDTSLTFWVYPDSFEAFRTIQTVMHDLGFAVAARPIPEGTPIGVSPRGSRSNAQ